MIHNFKILFLFPFWIQPPDKPTVIHQFSCKYSIFFLSTYKLSYFFNTKTPLTGKTPANICLPGSEIYGSLQIQSFINLR